MSPPSNKIIPITHAGDGTLTFPVPLVSPTSPERLILKTQISEHLRGDKVMETPFRLELLKIGGNLQNMLKKNGSFYVGLLQEGFLQNGAITLIGLMPPLHAPSSALHTASENIFKAVIQVDGDIICQIDRKILKEKHAAELIEGYSAVQHQFLAEFNKVLHSIRLLMLSAFSLSIPALYFIWKFFQ